MIPPNRLTGSFVIGGIIVAVVLLIRIIKVTLALLFN